MTKPIGLADKVVRLDRAFARAKIPHAFGGALALAYYSVPRATVDVDLNVFVSVERYDSVSATLRRAGLDTIPDEAHAVREGQMRAWWGTTPVDVFFACDEIHWAMRDATRTVPFGSATIPILAPEHLMVAKVVFNRAKDWLDIEQMLIAVDVLDAGEVRRWTAHLLGSEDPRYTRIEELIDRNR